MVDPGINPTDRIDSIRTIRGDLIADEEIFRNRFIHPFFKPALFFKRPAPIADFPDLIGGFPDLIRIFIQRLADARSRDKNDQK
jgi:hypothetical protein